MPLSQSTYEIGDWRQTIYPESPYYWRDRAERFMDSLSDVLSLLKPRSYRAGGFDLGGDFAIKFPKHESIKCYAVVSGQCWLSVEDVPEAVRLTAKIVSFCRVGLLPALRAI
jgi:hypothetical protein